jgi:hypothetical protein
LASLGIAHIHVADHARQLINTGQPEAVRFKVAAPSRRRFGRHSRAKLDALDRALRKGWASNAAFEPHAARR